MALDPEIRKLLDDLAPVMGELDEQTPAEARALADEGMAAVSGPGDPSITSTDVLVPGAGGDIPVRVYTPPAAATPLPVVVYLHGGGFVIGSIRSHDGMCRDLTAAAGNRCSGASRYSTDAKIAPVAAVRSRHIPSWERMLPITKPPPWR